MYKKILIANRGEIAVRIIRTCKEMSIKTVAVYSEPDRSSPHVYLADEAYALPGKTSAETYLNQDKIIEIAHRSGSDAIHPGYGFLSENAQFADRVQRAGLVFIGPDANSIRMMGDKTAARKLMLDNQVPVIPGTTSAVTDLKEVARIADSIGFPVLIKAAAGGGGKGMRIVPDPDSLQEAVEGAAREAKSAFGDASVYIEKYLQNPRHIEFQILSDGKGNIIHLGERECSIQRRHQKVIEEAPSAVLDDDMRKKMGQAAVEAASACHYKNAGTIEFLLDQDKNFYFLEMNTRLQVEHPVTEMVTGLDLVREQILIAAGEEMTLGRSVECFWGHALECRLYAEDPQNNFAPSPGKLTFLCPADGPGVREDSGVSQNSEISLFYDPMISKLVAWGSDRNQAVQRMIRALREYEIQGIKTNIPFLIRVLEHSQFKSGNLSTFFIQDYEEELFGVRQAHVDLAALAAALYRNQQNGNHKVNTNHKKQTSGSEWKIHHRRLNMRAK